MKSKLLQSKPKTHFCKDIYKAFAIQLLKDNPEYWSKYNYILKVSNYVIYKKSKQGPEVIIDYPMFQKILQTYYTLAKTVIIQGGEFNLGNNLGVIAARRVERNHKNKSVNFVETAKQPRKENGKPERVIYYTDDDWCRIGWVKSRKIQDQTFYEFRPTSNDMRGGGFKHEFSQALQKNPLLKFKYKYYPYVTEVKNDL